MLLLITIFRSLDSEAPEDGGDEAEDEAEDRQPQYKVLVTSQHCLWFSLQVLADYEAGAGAGRELSLTEGEVVRLVKIGCAGWWWVTSLQSESVSVIHYPCHVSGTSSAGTERAGRQAPTFKYCLEIQRHLTEKTRCWWKENNFKSSLHSIQNHEWQTTDHLTYNCNQHLYCFISTSDWLVGVVVSITNTLNLFWWDPLKLDVVNE